MYESHDVQADMEKEEQARLILCFDGTGNQYSGDTSDTNVVKLYQKFNRKTPNQYHYYQRKFGFRVSTLDPFIKNNNKTLLGLNQ